MVSGLEDGQEPWSRTWGENITEPSLPATNSGKRKGELQPNSREPIGHPGQSWSLAPDSVCQQCWQINLDEVIAREANNSREEGLDKPKGEIYFRRQQPREGKGTSLGNLPLGRQDGHREIYGGVQAGACKRAGREHVIKVGGGYIQPMTNIRREWTCGVWSSRHSFATWALRAGGWYVPSHCKMPSPMLQESVIRSKNNGFQLEHKLEHLLYFWWGLELSKRAHSQRDQKSQQITEQMVVVTRDGRFKSTLQSNF